MALFGNENKKTIEELENYYSNKTQRTGMAWAMAFLSLLITVAVLGGLFFGGRWIYRSLTDDASTPIAQQNDKNDSENNDSAGSVIGGLGLSLNDSQTDGVVSDEAASTSEPNNDTVVAVDTENDTDSENTDEANTSEEDSQEVAASVTERAEGELPDTGASSSILFGIPLVSFVAAYWFARKRQLDL